MFPSRYPNPISSTWIDSRTTEAFTDEQFDLFTSTIFSHLLLFILFFCLYNCSDDDKALNTLEIVQLDWSTRDQLKPDEQFWSLSPQS
jgi:hypothetical protein